MYPMNRTSSPAGQSGTVLLVAIVLLLLAGVMTLLALNVGVFEQRSTANDARAKTVAQVGEAGLAQGFEFLMRQHSDWLDDSAKWTKCVSNDTKFPCGAVAEFEPDGTTPRRATMYRYNGGTAITGIPTALSDYMLPLTTKVTDAGNGFTVAYGVAPLLCRVAKPVTGAPAYTPVRCATDIANASNQRIGTFVSVASIPGEAARTTLVQTVGRYSILDNPSGLPPVIAAGSVDLVGGLNVVTNPNAAGAGVPVSVWTRKDVDKHGNVNTCYYDEFLRFSKHGTPALEGTNTQILTCDDCDCEGDQSLSYPNAGGSPAEGIDILDVDSDTGPNRDVRPEEFPCDLFNYVFHVNAWSDTNPVDHFCETRIPKAPFTPDWNLSLTRNVYPDEAFLYKNAKHIIVNPAYPDAAAITAGSGKVVTTAYLDQNASGIVWCQVTDCGLDTPGAVIGSPDHPVVLIADGTTGTKLFVKAKIFGLLFVRTNSDGPLAADLSNAATYRMNAGGIIYGALVVQGQIEAANGHASVVYNGDILNGIYNDPDNFNYATLPGAWTDLKSY